MIKKRASQGFLDPIQKRALSRSVQLEAVYLEALLYLSNFYFIVTWLQLKFCSSFAITIAGSCALVIIVSEGTEMPNINGKMTANCKIIWASYCFLKTKISTLNINLWRNRLQYGENIQIRRVQEGTLQIYPL